MNRRQLIAMWIGVAALVGCLIYPPAFVERRPYADRQGKGKGSLALALNRRKSLIVDTDREWGWAWRDRERDKGPTERLISMPNIDKRTLGIEVAIVVLITGALIVSLKDRRST